MLEYFQTYINTSVNNINLTKYNKYISNISINSINILKNIKLDFNISKYGCYYLKNLLNLFPLDIDKLKSYNSTILLLDYIDNVIENNLQSILNYNNNASTYNLFINSNTNNNVLYINNIQKFSYYKLNNIDLDKITPLRCIKNSSLEYTIYIQDGLLTYEQDIPSNLIFILDIKALLFIWYTYIIKKAKQPNFNIFNIDILDIYKNYIFIPFVYNNQTNLIFNILNQLSSILYTNKDNTSFIRLKSTLDLITISFTKNIYKYADINKKSIDDLLFKKLIDIKNNNLSPQYFLNSLNILDYNIKTFLDYFNYLSNISSIYYQKSVSIVTNLLKDISYFKLLYNLYNLQYNSRERKKLIDKTLILLDRYKRNIIYDYVSDKDIKSYIQNNILTSFYNKLKNEYK